MHDIVTIQKYPITAFRSICFIPFISNPGTFGARIAMLAASKYSILPDSRLNSCLACMIKLCPLLALWLQASAAIGSLAPLKCLQKKKERKNTDPLLHISWFMAGWWGGKANLKQFSL